MTMISLWEPPSPFSVLKSWWVRPRCVGFGMGTWFIPSGHSVSLRIVRWPKSGQWDSILDFWWHYEERTILVPLLPVPTDISLELLVASLPSSEDPAWEWSQVEKTRTERRKILSPDDISWALKLNIWRLHSYLIKKNSVVYLYQLDLDFEFVNRRVL
jgi:hypothetical protein